MVLEVWGGSAVVLEVWRVGGGSGPYLTSSPAKSNTLVMVTVAGPEGPEGPVLLGTFSSDEAAA